MEFWGWPLMGFLLIGIFVIAAVVLFWLYLRNRTVVIPAHAEYWVYSKLPQIPDQTELMAQMVGSNPYIRRGQNPIGPAEGLMFSDVRFKLALVLRKKNPDFFSDSFLTHHDLPDQTDAAAIIKLQYSSDIALKHVSHLQFLLHLADAVQRMQGTGLVFDAVQKLGYSGSELPAILASKLDVTGQELHVTLVENEDHSFESRGFSKIGVKEFRTPPVPFDHAQSVRELLKELIEAVWLHRRYDLDSVEKHGDHFIFDFKESASTMLIRIHRLQEKSR